MPHGIKYVICRTILYFCLFDLILLVLVNNFSMMYRIVPWVGLLVEQFLKFNTNSAVSVTRACK